MLLITYSANRNCVTSMPSWGAPPGLLMTPSIPCTAVPHPAHTTWLKPRCSDNGSELPPSTGGAYAKV